MNAAELITFCTLKGDVNLHERLKDNHNQLTDFYHIRMWFNDDIISFQYHKDENDELTFIKGRINIRKGRLGISSEEIHGFKHLEETLTK